MANLQVPEFDTDTDSGLVDWLHAVDAAIRATPSARFRGPALTALCLLDDAIGDILHNVNSDLVVEGPEPHNWGLR